MKQPTGLYIATHSAFLTASARKDKNLDINRARNSTEYDRDWHCRDFICMLSHDCTGINPIATIVNEEVAVLSSQECEHIIDKAEEYASQNGGWTTGRHRVYATTDIRLGSSQIIHIKHVITQCS
jgi:hypothetical protein